MERLQIRCPLSRLSGAIKSISIKYRLTKNHLPASGFDSTELSMSTFQSWSGLPDFIKRQAAPDMLRGMQWYFYGMPVVNPGQEELLRWVPDSVRQFLRLPRNQGNLVHERIITPEKQQILTAAPAKTPPPAVYRSNRNKLRDVEAALRANPAESNRAIAAMTGTTHPFVAKTRRKLESVTR